MRSEIFFNGFYQALRQAGHVALLGERRGAYSVLVGKLEVKRRIERTRNRRDNNIKTDLQEV